VAEEPEIKREIQMKWWCRLIFDEAGQAARAPPTASSNTGPRCNMRHLKPIPQPLVHFSSSAAPSRRFAPTRPSSASFESIARSETFGGSRVGGWRGRTLPTCRFVPGNGSFSQIRYHQRNWKMFRESRTNMRRFRSWTVTIIEFMTSGVCSAAPFWTGEWEISEKSKRTMNRTVRNFDV
jgi:hypothetical protein